MLSWNVNNKIESLTGEILCRFSYFYDHVCKQVDSVQPVSEHAWIEFEKMFDQLAGSSDDEDEDGWSCQEEKKGQLRNPFFMVKLRQVSIISLINQINSVGTSWSSLTASLFTYTFILGK